MNIRSLQLCLIILLLFSLSACIVHSNSTQTLTTMNNKMANLQECMYTVNNPLNGTYHCQPLWARGDFSQTPAARKAANKYAPLTVQTLPTQADAYVFHRYYYNKTH